MIEENNAYLNYLADCLSEIKINMPVAAQEKCVAFLCMLEKWNRSFNLTAIKEVKDMIVKHMVDSLAIAPYTKGDTLLDVGTGAGFPGIPLALLYPARQHILLDSNGKKTRFLQQAISALSLSNVEIVHQRIENYCPSVAIDTITFRAVKSVEVMLEKTLSLCHADTRLLAMVSGYNAAATPHYPHHYGKIHALRVPGLTGAHQVIALNVNKKSR